MIERGRMGGNPTGLRERNHLINLVKGMYMFNVDNESRLRIIKRRIIKEVEVYYCKFNDGMPMSSLSAKYARALQFLGGFPEVIEGMNSHNELSVTLEKSGARKVLPGSTTVVQISSAADWF